MQMSAEFKILSPADSARDCIFARYCKQISEGIWAVVDVSVDAVLPRAPIAKCHKRPSGCIIRALPNGCSEVTVTLLLIINIIFVYAFVWHMVRVESFSSKSYTV